MKTVRAIEEFRPEFFDEAARRRQRLARQQFWFAYRKQFRRRELLQVVAMACFLGAILGAVMLLEQLGWLR